MYTKLADIERFMMADIPEREYPHEQPWPENVRMHPVRAETEIPVVDVLRGVYHSDLVNVVVIGLTKEGKEKVWSSKPDAAENIYLCTRAIHYINVAMDEQQGDLPDDPPTAA